MTSASQVSVPSVTSIRDLISGPLTTVYTKGDNFLIEVDPEEIFTATNFPQVVPFKFTGSNGETVEYQFKILATQPVFGTRTSMYAGNLSGGNIGKPHLWIWVCLDQPLDMDDGFDDDVRLTLFRSIDDMREHVASTSYAKDWEPHGLID